MPRLIDDLRAGGKVRMPWFVQPSKEAVWIDYAKRITELANNPELPVLVIDNVAEYLYAGTDQEQWSLDRDFPNLAPPFPMFWCEFKMVRTIHSKEKGDTDGAGNRGQGLSDRLICDACGAVEHGNLTCRVCRQHIRERSPHLHEFLDRLDAENIETQPPVGPEEIRQFLKRLGVEEEQKI